MKWFQCLCPEEMDVTKAVAVLFNHRHERFVKRAFIKILEEYAKATDNTIDDNLVQIVRRRLNIEWESSTPLTRWERKNALK